MKRPARVPGEPSAHFGMLLGGVVVENGVDELAGGHDRLDPVEEADEFLVAMARHALAGHRAVEDIERGEQRGRAVPDIIVGHRPGPPLLDRQARLSAVESLNLRLFVDRQHQAVGRRVEVQPDDVAQLGGKGRILRQFEAPHPVGCRRCAAQIRCTERSDTPAAVAIARPVQWVASPGGSVSVSATTRSTSAGGNGSRPCFRVFSRSRPATPSRMNRSCQRHTHGFETSARRMISAVPQPSAVARMIRARQTCFCGLFRSATTAANRSRSAPLTSMLIPSRMLHDRT